MNKTTVSTRLPSLMVEKIQQVADEHHNGDRTAALINLLSLGLQAYGEGKELIPPKYDLPEEIILAIEAEIRDRMRSHHERLESKFREIETQIDKKLKRISSSATSQRR